MIYYSDFRDAVLLSPIKQGSDSLKIISGYATPSMASWHIKEIASKNLPPIKITLIVGMCSFDGISESVHEGFKGLVSRNNISAQSNFKCQYIIEGTPVHSKLYIWERGGRPEKAFMGSANYTQPAFSKSRRELIQDCDPDEALNYFNLVEKNSIYCNHSEVEEKINIIPIHPVLQSEEPLISSIRGLGVENITLSLLTNKGDTGYGSGINWGHRPNGTKREPNQAYIPLPARIARSGFFPIKNLRSGKDNPHFSVVTDDGVHLILRVEQQGSKAITTPLDNSRIGEYLRSRIDVANGAFVRRQDLEEYGRTSITFYKLDDEQYVMDFSI